MFASPSAAPPGAPGRRPGAVDLLTLVTVVALIATVALIVLGSTVRVTNSGMGCASWPLCNGHIGPIDRFHALLEQSHRYLAALVSVLVVVAAALAWRRRGQRPEMLGPALAAVGALVVQVALGALTVLADNAGWTVGLHLVCAEILAALVAVTAQRAWRRERPTGRIDPWAMTMVALLAATIAAGASVVDGGAASTCRSWPLCPAGAPTHVVALELTHRLLAAAAGVTVVIAAVRMHRRGRRRTVGPLLLVVLLALQGAAGGVSAVLGAPAAAADVHLGLATLLWLTGVLTAFGPDGRRPWASGAERRALRLAVTASAGSAPLGQPAGPRQHVVEHGLGQGAGEGVQLAGMVRAQQRQPAGGADLHAVPEARPRPHAQLPDQHLVGELAEDHHHPQPAQQGQLPAQERQAAVSLGGGGPVGRRGAADAGGDVDAS